MRRQETKRKLLKDFRTTSLESLEASQIVSPSVCRLLLMRGLIFISILLLSDEEDCNWRFGLYFSCTQLTVAMFCQNTLTASKSQRRSVIARSRRRPLWKIRKMSSQQSQAYPMLYKERRIVQPPEKKKDGSVSPLSASKKLTRALFRS